MNRRTKKPVAFHSPFQFHAMTQMRPAGVYELMVEEEPVGDFVFEAFRRISTAIYLPPRAGDFGMGQIVPLDTAELEVLSKLTSPDIGSVEIESLWLKNWLRAA